MTSIKLSELEFERLGRLHGELLAMQVQVLQAQVAVLREELARRDGLLQDGPGGRFNAEMERLGEAYGFDPRLSWRLDAATLSLVPAGDRGPGGGGTP